jgi:hypothetical protein
MAKTIFSRRVATIATISSHALGTAGASAAPTSMLELPKQGVIAAADLNMCITIYAIWFDERLSKEEMLDLLLDVGMATVASGVIIYGGVKVTEGLLAEAMNLLGPLGWAVSAVITGTVTCTVGFTFWAWCERAPRWLAPATA